MHWIIELLTTNELFLLFTVIVLGLLLARVEVKGVRIGIAGVLFAGLGVSAVLSPRAPELALAPELKELGLVLFVYCVGLSSGPGFFAAFRSQGLKLNLAMLAALLVGALVAVVGGNVAGLDRGYIAGVFCGALTNTPALGAASDQLLGSALALHPVIAYSVSYPLGVLGALLSFRAFVGWRRARLSAEIAEQQVSQHPPIANGNFVVTQNELARRSIGELGIRSNIGVVISRLRRNGDVIVPTKYTALELGDVVTAVGTSVDLARAAAYFGATSEDHLEIRRDRVDMRRVLVSKRDHVGCSLSELDLERRFNAQVTRLRRADLDIVPSPDLRLELGDRLRVVAPTDRLPALSAFFGDSERELAEIDFVALALGLCAGLLLGQIPISILGTTLELGTAGGPLVVSLLVGRLGRTGPLVWALPYEANTLIRELGLLLFLAGVGTSAGGKLAGVLDQQGLAMLVLGAVVTLVTSGVALVLAELWAKASVVSSLGASSGMQTQPATLAAAYELGGRSEETYVAYAVVYPVAMIAKILLAQVIALSL